MIFFLLMILFFGIILFISWLQFINITCSCCFSFDNGHLHVFDFNTNKKKVDFANNYIFQMVSG